MKLKNKMIYLLAAGVVFMTGCKKQLDLQPTDSFNDANAFQTMEHLQLGVNGAFGRTSAFSNDIYVSALLSDEATLGAGNAGQGALTYRLQYGSDGTTGADVTGAYYSYYRLIDQVNRVLIQIPKVPVSAGDEARKKVLEGQLLALRAFGHFHLLRMYADRYDPAKLGVPLMTQPCVTCKPARNTMGEVMAQIEKDFADAYNLLPETNAGNFTDTVMNRINVAAFRARVALYKGDWANAIIHATTVINSNVRPLAAPGNQYRSIWTADAQVEVLFRRRYNSTTDGMIGELFTTGGGTIYIAPSDKLFNAFPAGDIRRDATVGVATGNRYVNKYHDANKGSARVADLKLIRIAEMYLIRAEANARSNNLNAGADDLNLLRSRRISGYAPVVFANTQELIDAVIQERFLELAFEGHRFFDLKRINANLERSAVDAGPEWRTLPANSYRWVLPIPRDEIIANPNTVQNPGYAN